MKSIVLRIILLIVIAYAGLFMFDLFLMFNNSGPLITIDEYGYEYEDVFYTEYTALGYKIVLEEQGLKKEASMHFMWTNTVPDIDFLVRDETGENCIDGRLYFYEDEHYEYYFGCKKDIKIEIDRVLYPITEALEEGLVTIEQLESEIVFTTTPKVAVDLDTTRGGCNEFDGDSAYFNKEMNGLYYYCLDTVNVYVNKSYYEFSEVYKDILSKESLLVSFTKEIEYDDGAIMYGKTSGNEKILECNNGDIIIGPDDMVRYDIFCK